MFTIGQLKTMMKHLSSLLKPHLQASMMGTKACHQTQLLRSISRLNGERKTPTLANYPHLHTPCHSIQYTHITQINKHKKLMLPLTFPTYIIAMHIFIYFYCLKIVQFGVSKMTQLLKCPPKCEDLRLDPWKHIKAPIVVSNSSTGLKSGQTIQILKLIDQAAQPN